MGLNNLNIFDRKALETYSTNGQNDGMVNHMILVK